MIFLREGKSSVFLTLHVQPRASRTQIRGLHGDALKILLSAPPVDGEANEAIIDFFSELLGKTKKQITIKSGETSRRKVLEIKDISLTEVHKILQEALP